MSRLVTVDLDDVSAIDGLDADDMLGAVAALPADASAAFAAGRATERLPALDGITAVVSCGMGGSAVAGDVLRSIFRGRLGVPIDVNRSPELPEYAGPRALVLVSSYSGGTEETLAAYREADARGCRIIAITSGGELGTACEERGHAVVRVPEGYQPRAALGYLAFSALGALEAAGLAPPMEDDVDEAVRELETLADEMGPAIPTAGNAAKTIATWLDGRVPVIWGAESIGTVAAMRWKTQMNENGKVPAWWSSMSELDHNEVVGWVRPYGEQHAVIALRSDGEPAGTEARFTLSQAIAADAGAIVREVLARGRSTLARLLTLILVGDFVSCYVGIRGGHDPTPVEAIARLKMALGT